MPHDPIPFTLTDPRTYDGDEFEVAERAVRQAEGLARLLRIAVESAHVLARNAELSRQEEPDAEAWQSGPHAARFDRIVEGAQEAERQLGMLAQAAGFNPKKVR